MDRAEAQRRYGWCKRTQAWVARDDMLGVRVQVFKPDQTVEYITIRLHPEAHRAFVAELRALEWENQLRTREELEAEGISVAPRVGGESDTAAWYAERQRSLEDNRAIARVLMRGVVRARSLGDLEEALVRAAEQVQGEALVEAIRGGRGLIPRWDERILDLPSMDRAADGCADMAVSGDEAEVLVLRLCEADGSLRVIREDHDRGEAILRARGVLCGGPPSLTR